MLKKKQTQAQGQPESVRDRIDGPITSKCPDNMRGRSWVSNPVGLRILNPLMRTFQLWKECRQEDRPSGHFFFFIQKEEKKVFTSYTFVVNTPKYETRKEKLSKV